VPVYQWALPHDLTPLRSAIMAIAEGTSMSRSLRLQFRPSIFSRWQRDEAGRRDEGGLSRVMVVPSGQLLQKNYDGGESRPISNPRIQNGLFGERSCGASRGTLRRKGRDSLCRLRRSNLKRFTRTLQRSSRLRPTIAEPAPGITSNRRRRGESCCFMSVCAVGSASSVLSRTPDALPGRVMSRNESFS